MKEIIKYTINQKVKGVDTYYNNGSIWLIFTDDKKWVIELTKDGTLWYNFYFFQDCFKYLSLDVVENQHYITEWVEDIIQNGVRSTQTRKHYYNKSVDGIAQNGVWLDSAQLVEDTIQNGIKDVIGQIIDAPELVNDAIRNGVMNTFDVQVDLVVQVEDTIQNGVRHTGHNVIRSANSIEDVIKNGVKHTEYGDWLDGDERFDDIINYGIKLTTTNLPLSEDDGQITEIEDVITNGIKETNWRKVDNHQTYLDTIINK